MYSGKLLSTLRETTYTAKYNARNLSKRYSLTRSMKAYSQ